MVLPVRSQLSRSQLHLPATVLFDASQDCHQLTFILTVNLPLLGILCDEEGRPNLFHVGLVDQDGKGQLGLGFRSIFSPTS